MTINLNPEKSWGLMAYTDGGARPNPGSSGCGLHGYLYEVIDTPPDIKPIRFTDGDAIKYAFTSMSGYIYCSKDGVMSSAANKSAIAVTPAYFLEMAESSSNQHTNNYAEMKSFLNAILIARTHKVKFLSIITDSEYTLKGATNWCNGWAANGWKTAQGEPVKNAELWQVIHREYQEAQKEGMKIIGQWVKGHKGHPGNSHADLLATVGVLKSQKGIDDNTIHYFTPKEYWEPKRDRHPLLSLKRLYFNREKDRNILGTYYMADPGKDDNLIGKPLPEAVFAIVKLKTPHPVVQAVLDAQYRYGQDFNKMMVIKMENIFTPEVFRLITTYGSDCMLKVFKGSNVELPDHRVMTIERAPIGITMRAIDSINSLESIVDAYEELVAAKEGDFVPSNIGLQIHDLTEELYQVSEPAKDGSVKKTLRKDIAVGQKNFSVTKNVTFPEEIKTITFPLKMSLDLPDRNSLKTLETSNPVVQLITWRESSISLRYATILTCDEGMAIWSNFYADRLLFKS